MNDQISGVDQDSDVDQDIQPLSILRVHTKAHARGRYHDGVGVVLRDEVGHLVVTVHSKPQHRNRGVGDG